jgi:hypothetical protein
MYKGKEEQVCTLACAKLCITSALVETAVRVC